MKQNPQLLGKYSLLVSVVPMVKRLGHLVSGKTPTYDNGYPRLTDEQRIAKAIDQFTYRGFTFFITTRTINDTEIEFSVTCPLTGHSVVRTMNTIDKLVEQSLKKIDKHWEYYHDILKHTPRIMDQVMIIPYVI